MINADIKNINKNSFYVIRIKCIFCNTIIAHPKKKDKVFYSGDVIKSDDFKPYRRNHKKDFEPGNKIICDECSDKL